MAVAPSALPLATAVTADHIEPPSPAAAVEAPSERSLGALTAPARVKPIERGLGGGNPRQASMADAPSRPAAVPPAASGADVAPALAVGLPAIRTVDAPAAVTAPRSENVAAAEAATLAPAVPAPAPPVGMPEAPAPSRDLDAQAIENVLGLYRNAFNRLDAGAASLVWPTVDEKTLARAFERLEDQDVSFESCQIEIAAALAEAACRGSARYVPRVGSRTGKAEARQWTFSLRKDSGEWLIDRVATR